jgi:hypothetical protein
MKLRTAFGVCIALVLTLLIVSAQTAAEGYSASPVKVISVVPEGDYEVGDTVTFEVHVFEKGERVEADNITVSIGGYWGRDVNATPTGTPGKYEVTFTINESDVSYGEVDVYITIEKGNVTSGDWVYFYVSEGNEEADIEVETLPTSSTLLEPGDTFSCEVMVTVDGDPTDADEKDIDLYGPEGAVKLNWTEIGTGKYAITYKVPNNITKFGEFSIQIEVYVANGSGWDYISFKVLDIQVWYEKISVNDTVLVARFWVNGLDGDGVNGALVDVEYDHDDDYYTTDIKMSGRTMNGSVKFTMPHVNMTGIYLEIVIKRGNNIYYLYSDIDWADDEDEPIVNEPDPGSFDVISEDLGYETGEHTYDFTAYNDTEPWASDWIYYYVGLYGSPAHKILAFGKVKTDAQGEFSVKFTTPTGMERYVICYFQAATNDTENSWESNDGRSYEEVTIYLTIMMDETGDKSSSVKISAKDALKLNDTNEFDVTIPGEFGLFMVFIVPVDAEVDVESSMYPVILWALIMPEEILLLEGKQTISLMLPSFLPEDQKFVFVAVSISEEGVKYNYLMLKVGQSGGTGDDSSDDDDSWIPGFEGIAVAAALGVALFAVRRKRR